MNLLQSRTFKVKRDREGGRERGREGERETANMFNINYRTSNKYTGTVKRLRWLLYAHAHFQKYIASRDFSATAEVMLFAAAANRRSNAAAMAAELLIN